MQKDTQVPISLTPGKYNQVHSMLIIKNFLYLTSDINFNTLIVVVRAVCLSVDVQMNGKFLIFQKEDLSFYIS